MGNNEKIIEWIGWEIIKKFQACKQKRISMIKIKEKKKEE